MIAIYLNNGDIIVDDFLGFDGDTPGGYTIKSDEHFRNLFGRIKVLRDSQGWYYSVDKVVKFKTVTDEELKALRREDKLDQILDETTR